MCTAITLPMNNLYFGRTLDLDRSYGEEIVITPRNFPLPFRHRAPLCEHHAMIGMAHVSDGYPLYYDAINEKGLCIAGLNFPKFAHYQDATANRENISSFEFIPWVLGLCGSIQELRERLPHLQLTNDAFSSTLQTTPLHWIIADKAKCITVEAMADGLHVYENTIGVLTNSPSFSEQMFQLQNYMHLSPDPPQNRFHSSVDLQPYSRGMGAIGLPGDLSSQSRFVRAAFTKLNSLCSDEDSIIQFFHIMETVSQTRGCCRLQSGSCEITLYTSCCNASKGIYYYTTYSNRRISAVDLNRENLDRHELIRFPLLLDEDIHFINGAQE